jgi:hypothetical protein
MRRGAEGNLKLVEEGLPLSLMPWSSHPQSFLYLCTWHHDEPLRVVVDDEVDDVLESERHGQHAGEAVGGDDGRAAGDGLGGRRGKRGGGLVEVGGSGPTHVRHTSAAAVADGPPSPFMQQQPHLAPRRYLLLPLAPARHPSPPPPPPPPASAAAGARPSGKRCAGYSRRHSWSARPTASPPAEIPRGGKGRSEKWGY